MKGHLIVRILTKCANFVNNIEYIKYIVYYVLFQSKSFI